MRRYPLLIVNVAALALAACSSQPCGPSTCVGGCCTATGECVSATEQSCGSAGASCKQCGAGEQCLAGVCGGGGTGGGGMPMNRCNATAVPCQDDSIMQLRLYATVNPDSVTEEGTAPDFKTRVDARAGGLSPTQSFMYLSFTETGLQKRLISDEQAFVSLDWDIALRRYILRINSGVSGPSCVEAARTAPMTSYDTLMQAPANLSWRTEEYFIPPEPDAGSLMCSFVADTSGMAGAPGTALSSFWTYMNCVQMTGNVYVIHLRDGRYVKFQVLSYYTAAAQQNCNQTGSATPTPNEAAVVRLRWAFISAPP